MDTTKTIWTVQNHFGPIEGQDIRLLAWYIFRHVQDILQHEKTKTVIQHFVRSYSNERNKNVTSTTLAINDVFELK